MISPGRRCGRKLTRIVAATIAGPESSLTRHLLVDLPKVLVHGSSLTVLSSPEVTAAGGNGEIMTGRRSADGSPVILHRGAWVIRSRPDGRIVGRERDGFFADDTRILSVLEWRLGDHTLQLRRRRFGSTSRVSFRASAAGVDIRTVRWLDLSGWHEHLVLASSFPFRSALELRLEADFADIFEVRGLVPPRARAVEAHWNPDGSGLRVSYRNGAFEAGLTVDVDAADSSPVRTDGGLKFEVDVPANGQWGASLTFRPATSQATATITLDDPTIGPSSRPYLQPVPGTERAWRRALLDLESLRLTDDDPLRQAAAPAAGIPWYAALFGRDALICAIQAGAILPDLARGTLIRLAALQATDTDPAREMEPGKIPHEYRRGELATLGLIPFGPYYGSHDATPLFLVALSEAWRTACDDQLVRDVWPNALRALDWIDLAGDRDGDGLQEYAPRTPGGFPNQGWRDSGDGIVDADGLMPHHPISLAEHQGYVFDARLRAAEMAEKVLGDHALARKLRAQAEDLRKRFDASMWWDGEGTYAFGLDGTKRQIRSVTSCGGHLLWSGIVSPERAGLVADRLLAEDLFSGWGLRTLSERHPAYDPFSYHRGSVWPHDTAIAVAGLRRYGFAAAADRLAEALLEAADRFPLGRLPEAFSGLPRTGRSRPVPLRPTAVTQVASFGQTRDPGPPETAELLTEANGPQAWAASAAISLILGRSRSRPTDPA